MINAERPPEAYRLIQPTDIRLAFRAIRDSFGFNMKPYFSLTHCSLDVDGLVIHSKSSGEGGIVYVVQPVDEEIKLFGDLIDVLVSAYVNLYMGYGVASPKDLKPRGYVTAPEVTRFRGPPLVKLSPVISWNFPQLSPHMEGGVCGSYCTLRVDPQQGSLISDIGFVSRFITIPYPRPPIVVYVGVLSGHHRSALRKRFPSVEFSFWSSSLTPSPAETGLHNVALDVVTSRRIFKSRSVVLIVGSSPQGPETPAVEVCHVIQLVRALNPVAYKLKVVHDRSEESTACLGGDLMVDPWSDPSDLSVSIVGVEPRSLRIFSNLWFRRACNFVNFLRIVYRYPFGDHQSYDHALEKHYEDQYREELFNRPEAACAPLSISDTLTVTNPAS